MAIFRIAICDDSMFELEATYRMVKKFIEERPKIDFFVQCFQSTYDLIECIQTKGDFSIYLLDIIMPEMNGIDIGEFIRKRDNTSVIIYLTASSEYAVSSYTVQAFHYLLKPLHCNRLFSVLDAALQRIESELAKSYLVKTADGIQAVRYHIIIYAECRAHHILYYLSDGTVIKSLTLRRPFDEVMAPFLKDDRFIKISASFIINMNFIQSMTNEYFVMTNGAQLSISRRVRSTCKKEYINFLLENTKSF